MRFERRPINPFYAWDEHSVRKHLAFVKKHCEAYEGRELDDWQTRNAYDFNQARIALEARVEEIENPGLWAGFKRWWNA